MQGTTAQKKILLCICVGFVSYLCFYAGFTIGPYAVEPQGCLKRVRPEVKKNLPSPQQGRTGMWKSMEKNIDSIIRKMDAGRKYGQH
jgi:hypothetical protein